MASKEALLRRIHEADRWEVLEVLREAPEGLRGDREVVLAAAKQHGYALGYVVDGLTHDREFVLGSRTRRSPHGHRQRPAALRVPPALATGVPGCRAQPVRQAVHRGDVGLEARPAHRCAKRRGGHQGSNRGIGGTAYRLASRPDGTVPGRRPPYRVPGRFAGV